MHILDVILISAALSVDNMAVAAAGSLKASGRRKALVIKEAALFSFTGLVFLLIGWLGGRELYRYIYTWDHWLSFILLAYIGAKMIKNAFVSEDQTDGAGKGDLSSLKTLFFLAFATNLDVLAVGLSLSFSTVSLGAVIPILMFFIAAGTFIGALAGRGFGARFGAKAEAVGGAVLIIIGLKILVDGF